MARYYAAIQGNRGESTRMGTACSGVGGHLRGWHIGIRVLVCPDPETGADKVQVWRTSGSEGRMGADTLIYEETLPTHINQS